MVFAIVYFIFDFARNVDTSVSPDLDQIMSNSFVGNTLNIISLILTFIWALWFIYTVIRCYVVARQHPRAIKGRYRYFVFFVIAATFLYIATLFLQNFYGATLAARLSLISHVVAGSFGIVLMLWLAPTNAPRSTSTTLQGALHPKEQEMRPVGENSDIRSLSQQEEETIEQPEPSVSQMPTDNEDDTVYAQPTGSINDPSSSGMTDLSAEDTI